MTPLYVQYGCGPCAPKEWVNFDASPMVWFQRIPLIGESFDRTRIRLPKNVRYGDIVKGLPVAPNSVDGLYASHVLEHLSFEECRRALANCHAILKPNGRFRLIVPDLKERTRQYLASNDARAANTFMRSLGMTRENRPRGVLGRLAQLFGRSLHLWMWDEASLAGELALEALK